MMSNWAGNLLILRQSNQGITGHRQNYAAGKRLGLSVHTSGSADDVRKLLSNN